MAKRKSTKGQNDVAKRFANYHVRQAKYKYERSIATNMTDDNKIFWKFIQSKTKSKENIPCIMDENGEVQMDNKIKAELLNKFFQSVQLKTLLRVFQYFHQELIKNLKQ